MAVLGTLTLNEIVIYEVDENPTIAGLEAASGSLAIMTDGSAIFHKGEGDQFNWVNHSVSDHGNLSGLSDDDHIQYLLTDGTRQMSGSLDMGSNDVTNAGDYNGVTVEAHASRHLPDGADPLATSTPVSTGVENSEGSANSFARADHIHKTLINSNFIFINTKTDFPAAVGGVITLANNTTYFITTAIDLTGDRLVAGQNTTIIGGSSENCSITSTGLSSSTALITSNYSLPMRNISITHGKALDLDGTGNASAALDWFGVNFVNCATVGTIKTYTNFIMTDCALLNSANMTFDGTIQTVGFISCLFSGIAGQTTLNFPSTLTITRRIRAVFSSFVAFGGATAIYVDPAVTFSAGAENYILITCNFSGGATYVGGTNYTSNNALFQNCRGITNSANVGQMYFINDATPNSIASQGVFEKIEGTTIASSINQKFSHSLNRLTYVGGLTKEFVITASCSANSVTTPSAVLLVRIAKNGATIAESESQVTTSNIGRNENFYCQAIVNLAPNDYIELFIANDTSTNSVIVTDLNLLARASG
jgi:hypothetical protein